MKIEEGEKSSQPVAGLASTVRQLVNQFQAKSDAAIKERVERARKRIAEGVTHLNLLAESRKSESTVGHEDFEDILTTRMKKSLCKLGGLDSTSSEKENNICQEDGSSLSSTIIFGGSSSGTSILPPIKLPYVEKIPRYTTWIFLERNQRMAEDQSVVGRRRIYYDQCGNEALICSDSEDEIADDEENKYDFTDGDDFVLRKIIQEYGHSEAVFNALSRYIRAKPSEIETRYKFLLKQDEPNKEISEDDIPTVETEDSMPPSFFEKCLDSAMDSFDNLFCRRCLVFDCRLHGCSQDLVLPIERQPSWSNAEEERVPCGSNCYLLDLKGKAVKSTKNEHLLDPFLPVPNPYIADDALVDCSSGERPGGDVSATVEKRKRDLTVEQDSSKRNTESESINAESDFEIYGNKLRGKQTVFDSMSMKSFQQSTMEVSSSMKKKQKLITSSDTDSSAVQQNLELETSMFPKWKPLERELYLKGIEIFGKNSCLIARNLLCDLKSCSEVAKYMSENDPAVCSGAGDKAAMLSDNSRKTGGNHGTDLRRTRFWRRRGKVRRLKYSWKSAGYPSIKKRSANSKGQPCRQYIPCGCQASCGKQCSCLRNGTCCEKYCGCSKSCKNRFRGCHCAKSQCRSRQCPCFAAGRECDPDVCRNCWVSCGDGNLGDPPQRGDNYECRNMNMLLKQQQRVLLGKSDVAGWGAFLRNPVVKHDYLGEYTGEIISHREADKRGKIYDRENSSFLFNLNNEFVLDAYRKGDKLKFANHSLNPNCYAKVIMVAGDHRVGIFAKENISGGEEIFYDYRYEQDKAPIWAKKREGSNSKKDEILSSCGRAKKIA